MKWFRKDMLLWAIIFITLTGGVSKIFDIRETDGRKKISALAVLSGVGSADYQSYYSHFVNTVGVKKISALEEKINLKNRFEGTFAYFYALAQLKSGLAVLSGVGSVDYQNYSNFVNTLPRDTETSNCRKLADYADTFKTTNSSLAQSIFVASVRCMLTTHYADIKSAYFLKIKVAYYFKIKSPEYFKIKSTYYGIKKSDPEPVRTQICDRFRRSNGILQKLINDISFWNTKYYNELKPSLSFTEGAFYEQKKCMINLLNVAIDELASTETSICCPLTLFTETKNAMNLLVFSGPAVN